MEVIGPQLGQSKKPALNHIAEIKTKEKIRLEFLAALKIVFTIEITHFKNWNPVRAREDFWWGEPMIFRRRLVRKERFDGNPCI